MIDIEKKVLKEIIGDLWISSEVRKDMEFLTRIPGTRFAGTDGEKRAGDYIEGKFKEYGIENTDREYFVFRGWERKESSMKISGHKDISFDVISLPYSPSSSLTAEIIDLGCGTEDDFRKDIEGKLVLVSSETPEGRERWIHRKEKYKRAVEGGASGFVFMNHIPGELPVTGSLKDNKIGEIPGLGISMESGERIRRLIEEEGNLEVEIDVDVIAKNGRSSNITGRINPEKKREIIFCAHYDSHDISQGALDNASGTVLMIELARIINRIKDKIDFRVKFISFGAEELGLTGSRYYVENNALSDIYLVFNLDCAGTGRNLRIHNSGFTELDRIIKTFSKNRMFPVSVDSRLIPHSDHWPFVRRGIPGFFIHSESDDRGRGWTHTEADSFDKIEFRNIKENAMVLFLLLLSIIDAEPEIGRKTEKEVNEYLKRQMEE